jgi:hypothetical protein
MSLWRSFWMAIGIGLVLLGLQFLVIERATWAKPSESKTISSQGSSDGLLAYLEDEANANPNDFQPDDWVPWAMLTGGAVIIIYSWTIQSGQSNPPE